MLEKIGKSSRSRERLSKLIREGGKLFNVAQAAQILEISDNNAAKALARWRNQGWLNRIKRGIYIPVPIESANVDRALEDGWIVIPKLFGPTYVGGWSAAEYWDLTEQIFRDICVFSARPVIKRQQVIHNLSFFVTHTAIEHHFGTRPVWRKGEKIMVSDPTKTIVDMLSNPVVGGGIQHVIDCLKQFFKSDHFNAEQLIEYAKKLGNRAVFKRLGFIATQLLGEENSLVSGCEAILSKGNAQLDPAFKGDKLITRWRLFVPAHLKIRANQE